MPKLKVKVGHILRDKETKKLYVVIDIETVVKKHKLRFEYGLLDFLRLRFMMDDVYLTIIPKEDFDKFNGYPVSDNCIKNYTFIYIDQLPKFEIMNLCNPYKITVKKYDYSIFYFNDANRKYTDKEGE